MGLNLTRLACLQEKMRDPYRHVRLVPHELINDGTAVTLIPVRGETTLDVDWHQIDVSTLPVLDLVKAGIEIDRRPDTIMASVRTLLRDKVDTICSHNYPALIAAIPLIKLELACGIMNFALGARSERDLAENLAEHMSTMIGMSSKIDLIIAPLEDVPGLTLSEKGIKGFMPNILQFAFPVQEMDEDTAEMQAFKICLKYGRARVAFGLAEIRTQNYLDKNGETWWFRFSRKKKKMESELEKLRQELDNATEEANAALESVLNP